MDDCGDFIQLLGPDVSMNILMNLVDPCDLVRVCLVSSSWHRFVIENGLFKQLCVKLFPEISGVVHTIEANDLIYPAEFKEHDRSKSECQRRNHRVYAFLSRALNLFVRKDCISKAIAASSTDNYPEESIHNTLEPLDRIDNKALYWSSEGRSDPSISESLLYKLMAKMCLVTEIHVQPFQAYFQYDFPIYSSKAVRFRMGHLRVPEELQSKMADGSTYSHKLADNKFIWTYTSPEFPMAQENCLQKFKLPEPVLCIGGILQVELLGRVQRQEMDGLYYICISHVQAVGRPLLPRFDIEMLDSTGRCALKYMPETEKCMLSSASPVRENGSSSRLRSFTARLIRRGTRGWEQMILNALPRSRAAGANDADVVPSAPPS
ncbi:F-box protein At4g00755-like isoform X2 [Hibiscus syriacus]|nr:F-box protein At4g00755-like isoform X2 [Hibiscus syriacus]